MNSKKKKWLLPGFIIFSAMGFIVMPPLLKKYNNKIYKAISKKEEIDFDNLGPDIVKKDDVQKED